MTQSMTAFALCETETQWGSLSWELRSVNHRYLELSPRSPEILRIIESDARALVAKRLSRGKVDMNLRFQPKEPGSQPFELDQELLTRLLHVAAQVKQAAADIEPLRTIDVLRWPGTLSTPDVDSEALAQAAMALLEQALDELQAMRRREGGRLAELLQQRIAAMGQVVTDVRAILPEVVQNYRERLRIRLEEIMQQLDPARLEQEIVLFAQKVDVDEELDRLDGHLLEIKQVLKGKGSIGRRLDFLMQELNREANTLASKAADVRLTNAAVELKVLIEQMREQVQNIE